MTSNHERRRNRSERPIEALGLLLESTVNRFSLKSAFLASEDGLLLVTAGESDGSDTLAAYAPLLAGGSDMPHLREAIAEEMLGEQQFNVRSCSTPNQKVFFVTLGDDSIAIADAAAHGGAGTERILAA